MQTPKGTVFFQVSGMVLILIATTLYQKGLPQEPKLSALATQRSDYERYEEGGYPGEDAVERNQRLQIAELLQRFTLRRSRIFPSGAHRTEWHSRKRACAGRFQNGWRQGL